MSTEIVTVGFAWSEITDRVEAIDAAIRALGSSIASSNAPRLNKAWRTEFSAFLRRWGVERNSYNSWGSRVINFDVAGRLDAFEESYRWWARSFEDRTGGSPALPQKEPARSMTDGLFGDLSNASTLLVGGGLLYLLLRGRK